VSFIQHYRNSTIFEMCGSVLKWKHAETLIQLHCKSLDMILLVQSLFCLIQTSPVFEVTCSVRYNKSPRIQQYWMWYITVRILRNMCIHTTVFVIWPCFLIRVCDLQVFLVRGFSVCGAPCLKYTEIHLKITKRRINNCCACIRIVWGG